MFCPGSRLGPTVCKRFGGNALLAADSSRLNCTGEGGVMSVLTVNISVLFVKSMILAINFDAMIIKYDLLLLLLLSISRSWSEK